MGTFDIKLYHSFSASYLTSATTLEEKGRNLETGLRIDNLKDVNEHRTYITASIMCSIAFLEASINEYFFWAQKGIPKHSRELGILTVNIWEFMENGKGLSILEKYNLALILLGKEPFEYGKQPYQDALAAVKLRNKLIHPELENEDNTDSIERRYSTKFKPLALANSRPYFPDQILSADCAKWVRVSLEKFVIEFDNKLGNIMLSTPESPRRAD